VSTKFGSGEDALKIFEAMVFKRGIGTSCSIDVKMLDTLKDGIVLIVEQKLVNSKDLVSITDFVNQHSLSLLLDSERYFISTNALKPSSLSVW
jgi:chaperonin GroEL (HSP60 family)